MIPIPPFTRGGHWLLTSAAAKVDLTKRMRHALNATGLRLYAADITPMSAAFAFADDHLQLPRLDADEFLDVLIDACNRRHIRVILPTRDADLKFLSTHAAPLTAAGIWPLVSPLDTIDCCLDKIRFHDHCIAHGLPVLPRLEHPAAADFPCFIRPRCGAGSTGSGPVASPALFQALHGTGTDLLVQPLCKDPEYSIDALFSPEGNAMQWVVRERLRIRAGESVVSRTVAIPAFDTVIQTLAASLPFCGPVTIQAFYSKSQGVRLIEVNPRFGGASALGIEAGLDTPARLVALAQGDNERFLYNRSLRMGLTMLRYAADVFIDMPTEPAP